MVPVWAAFCRLSNSRSTGFNGPDPITFEQIKAWQEVTQTKVNPRDIDTILKLDRIFMKVYNSDG